MWESLMYWLIICMACILSLIAVNSFLLGLKLYLFWLLGTKIRFLFGFYIITDWEAFESILFLIESMLNMLPPVPFCYLAIDYCSRDEVPAPLKLEPISCFSGDSVNSLLSLILLEFYSDLLGLVGETSMLLTSGPFRSLDYAWVPSSLFFASSLSDPLLLVCVHASTISTLLIP